MFETLGSKLKKDLLNVESPRWGQVRNDLTLLKNRFWIRGGGGAKRLGGTARVG